MRESHEQPLLLVCEDLHWIDAETQALLDRLVESLPTTRLLLLVNYRPEYQHAWGSKTSYTQLRLDPLPPASAEAFLAALLGDDPSLAPLTQLLIVRTEGNPFFLEESVRTLGETGVLVGAPGAYRLAQALPTIQVPATVQAVLAARIDRLPPEHKRLLQTAAVIGTEVPITLLRAIADLPDAALSCGLAHLQTAEFLYETRLFPEPDYTFKHALTHEVAYGSLLLERRRVLHTRIVETLERLSPDRLAEQVEPLAHHALRGEAWDKALTYCRQAGEKAMARSARREAVGYFEQALRALAHLPDQRDTREHAIDLRLALCRALQASGALERILACLREVEALAERLDDPRRLGQVADTLSNHFRRMGAYDQAHAAAQRALTLATASGEVVLQALAHVRLGQVYQTQGDNRRAIACLEQTVVSLDEARGRTRLSQASLPVVHPYDFVQPYALLAWCHAELGTFAEGRTLGDAGLRVAEAVAHPTSLMMASWAVGRLALRQGDLRRALPRLAQALRLARTRTIRPCSPWWRRPWGRRIPWTGALLTPWCCSRRPWSRRRQRTGWTSRRSVVSPWGRPMCWPAAWRRRTPLPRARWWASVRGRNVATRPMPCASWARLGRNVSAQRWHRSQPPTSRLSPSLKNSACVRSRPTATGVWARCMPRPASGSRPALRCPRPSKCTVNGHDLLAPSDRSGTGTGGGTIVVEGEYHPTTP